MKFFSEETRKRMSESAKRRCSTPEWKAFCEKRRTKLQLEDVKRLYNSGMTQAEVAEVLGTTQKVIFSFMKRNNIPARQAAKREQHKENNSYWRGGRTLSENGYVYLKCDDHPRARKCGGYVFEHILVAEKLLGRLLFADEVVHHINGVKCDNCPQNLVVMKKADHIKLHWKIRKFEKDNGVGTAKGAKEVKEFLDSIAISHFGDEDAGIEGDIRKYL